MPGTYRYSATFDRTYEEPEPNPVRFSIQSWQGSIARGEDDEENGSLPTHVRSPSNDSLASGSSGGSGQHSRQVSGEGHELGVSTKAQGKPMTSPIRNPLQFVKVGPVPLYKKLSPQAEEQIKLLTEVKQATKKANENEEWQMNLDKWKSRRKKVSEKTIQRVEEQRQIENAAESQSTSQRKIKTFSEMLEERSHKPRAYNLAIYKDSVDGSEESKTNGHSAKNIDINSNLPQSSKLSNGDQDDDEAGVGDSGLESFGSSQRTYDIPDSSSEISGGSLDRLGTEDDTSNEGITTGMDMLEEFSSPSSLSSRDLNEEQPIKPVDMKCLEKFFKSSSENENVTNGDDSSIPDCHSTNEKSKKTPPPVPVKPKLLRADRNLRASGSLPSKSVISKTVAPMTRTENSLHQEREVDRQHTKNSPTLRDESAIRPTSKLCREPSTLGSGDLPACTADSLSADDAAVDIADRVGSEDLCDTVNRHEEEPTESEERYSKTEEEKCIEDYEIENHEHSNDIYKSLGVENPKCDVLAASSLRGNIATHYMEVSADLLKDDDSDTTVAEEQIVKIDAKAEVKSIPSHVKPLTPVAWDTGLTVIYQSHPPSTARERHVSEEGRSPASVDKVVLNNIIDELEDAIKCEMESEEASASLPALPKEAPVPKKDEADLYDLALDLYTDEQLLANLEAPPSQVEPPKERPPPPPPPVGSLSLSLENKSVNAGQAADGVQRMNTFKRMKKEMWRRRSDFLGIDPSEDVVDVVPPPPDLQEMLKSEREIERQWMEQNRPTMVPAEEEIVQKEREIIENLEREERERREGEKDEQELMLDQGKECGSPKQEDEERIRRLKDERRRMEEERFQREEQRMRLEEERLLREREEQMRRQEEALRLERERLQQEREAFRREKEEYDRKMEEQKRLEAQKLMSGSNGSLPGREELICASKFPQGFTAVDENGGIVQDKNQIPTEPTIATDRQPVIMRNRLQSLGAAPKAKFIKNEQWINEEHDKAAKRRSDPTPSRYNRNHWLIQEAEMRRLAEQSERQRDVGPVPVPPPKPPHVPQGYPVEQQWNYRSTGPIPWRDPRKSDPSRLGKPPVASSEPPDRFLSVSGKEKCSHCGHHLGRGEAMIIESLQLCYHLQCFRCCVCRAQLGNGSCGTDVRVRNNKLHCQNCYSNDEAGLKFSQV